MVEKKIRKYRKETGRTEWIAKIRATSQEKALFVEAAQKAGLSQADYLQWLIRYVNGATPE